MTEPIIDVRVTKTMTVELTEEQAAVFLRKAVGAPDNAVVNFDCGFEYLEDVTVTWTETDN